MTPKRYFKLLTALIFGGAILFVINFKLGDFLHDYFQPSLTYKKTDIDEIDIKPEDEANENNIIGSWTQKFENNSPVVFTFLEDTTFYSSIGIEGKYKFENQKIFLFYNNGDANILDFNSISPDIMEGNGFKFIKRPDIFPKAVDKQKTKEIEYKSKIGILNIDGELVKLGKGQTLRNGDGSVIESVIEVDEPIEKRVYDKNGYRIKTFKQVDRKGRTIRTFKEVDENEHQ